MLGLAGGGDAKFQMRDGVCFLQNPRNAGVAIVAPNRLVFTSVEIVIDPGAFTSWSQLAACETERMTGLRRLRVVPGPYFLLQLGEGNELRFGVGTDGSILLPKEETRFKANANTLTWIGGETRP